MKFRNIIYSLLTEDQEGVYKKHYSDIPRNNFIRIASADPKTKIVDNKIIRLGSYYPFLINMYRNNNLRFEDLPKATEYLELVYKYQIKIGQMKFDTISDLYEIVKDKIAKTTTTLSSLIAALQPSEYKVIHNGENWFVIVAKTEKASAYLGANTEWCTAWGDFSLNPSYKDRTNYFHTYSPQGPLYIIVNKENENDKYQLHFPTNQLKNPADKEITNRPTFFNERLEIKKLFFPELYTTNNSKDDIKSAYSKIKKFLSDADIKIISNQLYDAYVSESNNPLIETLMSGDEEGLAQLFNFDSVEITIIRDEYVSFELKELPSIVDQYDDYIRSLHSAKNGAWDYVRDSEYYYYKDDKQERIRHYLEEYYEKNKKDLIEKFGKYARTKDAFLEMFLEQLANDATIAEKYIDSASEAACSSLENALESEINYWEGYLDMTNGWSDKKVDVPIEHLIGFLGEKNLTSFDDIDQFFEYYVDYYDIPTELNEYPDYDSGSPSKETMFNAFDDYLEATYEHEWGNKIGDEDVPNSCIEKRQKFLEIVKNYFNDDSIFENEFVKIEIEEPWMKNFDCENGIKVKYKNKKTGEEFEGSIQIDNLINHMNIEPLLERLSFKSILKDLN